jgi:hypothetical protein
MALIAILIRIRSGSPILFTQERVGKVRSAQVTLIWWLFLLGTLALNYGNNKHCLYPTDTAGNTEIKP